MIIPDTGDRVFFFDQVSALWIFLGVIVLLLVVLIVALVARGGAGHHH